MISPIAFLNAASADALVLFACRLGGLLLVAPVFSSRAVPMKVRTGLLLLLTWLLAPVALQTAGAPSLTPGGAITEMLIGFGLGLGAAVFVGAAETLGEMLAINIGLSGAAALDPLTNQSIPVLAQFSNLFILALLLSANMQFLMLDAVAASVRLIPVGSEVHMQAGLARMISVGSMLFLLGLRFAAPVVAVVLLGNAALAILARVAPQLNVLGVAFPLQIGVGLFAFAAAIPLIGSFFDNWPGMYEGMVMQLLGAFVGAGGP